MQKSGRTVVVIGCSRGIGLGILVHLANSPSCKTLVGVARNPDDIVRLRSQFADNPKVHIFRADMTSAEQLSQLVKEIVLEGIAPDLLICNAGILTEPRSIDMIPVQDMMKSLEVNVVGPFNTMQAFLPIMRDVRGAVIANVSSEWGKFGSAGQATYCASKHGLEGLVKCAAADVANDKVSIVTVGPGMVVTDMLATAFGGKENAERLGVPVDKFAGPFCEKVMAITKADSGKHVICSYTGS